MQIFISVQLHECKNGRFELKPYRACSHKNFRSYFSIRRLVSSLLEIIRGWVIKVLCIAILVTKTEKSSFRLNTNYFSRLWTDECNWARTAVNSRLENFLQFEWRSRAAWLNFNWVSESDQSHRCGSERYRIKWLYIYIYKIPISMGGTMTIRVCPSF